MEGKPEDMTLDVFSVFNDELDFNDSNFDPFQVDVLSCKNDNHFNVYGSPESNFVKDSFKEIEFFENNLYSSDSIFQELSNDVFLGVENEPIVLELSASGEHQEANLEFTESCHPDQSLNVELQGGSSSNGSDCSPSTSSLYSISSLDLGYSSELNNSCSIESSSSSFEFCESDCVVKKCKVACSSVKDSSSPGDLDTFAETSSSEKMVAPLALAKTSTLVEVPKLKTGVGYHVAPACGKGKTIHAFGPCSPLSCKSKKSAPKLKKLQPLEEIKMATSNVPNTTSRVNNLNTDTNEKISAISQSNKNLIGEYPLHRHSANSISVIPTNGTKLKKIITVKKSEAYQSKVAKRKIEDLPFWSLKPRASTSVQNTSKKRKCRAYQLEPLHDPKLERCRRNAINAKKNREAKKELISTLQQDLLSSQEENRTMKNRVQNLESQVEQLFTAFKALQEEKQRATTLAAQLQAENFSLQEQLKLQIH